MVPAIAFETLVEWIKYKSIANRQNIPLSSRNWQKDQYIVQKRNMELSLARRGLSLGKIAQISRMVPGINWGQKSCVVSSIPECRRVSDNGDKNATVQNITYVQAGYVQEGTFIVLNEDD